MTKETKAMIKTVVYNEMEKRRSHSWKEQGNKYYHGERVASIALKLRKHIFPDVTEYDDVLEVAAWFHDICNGEAMHNERGAETAKAILAPYLEEKELDLIYYIIYSHDKRSPDGTDYEFYLKLHQDADLLDHYGCFDIWTEMFHSAAMGANVHHMITYLEFERPGTADGERRLLNYDISREIFDDKAKFLKQFADRFLEECTTGIANEEKFFGKKL